MSKQENSARPVTPWDILVEKLRILSEQAPSIADVDGSFLETLSESLILAQGLNPYIGSITTEESVDLQNLVQSTHTEDWKKRFQDGDTTLGLEQEMVSGHIEGQFLKLSLIHI